MSWINIFPSLDDEALDRFENEASEEERAELAGLFRVAEVIPARRFGEDSARTDSAGRMPVDTLARQRSAPRRHIVAASLFWKPAVREDMAIPAPTRELLKDPVSKGITGRINHPWDHYVEPLLQGAILLAEKRPEVIFRVYLANDLAFLVPDLLDAGCEVALMESSSIAHNPGAMWRFLAMEEEDCLVTITDSDRAQHVIHDVERTEIVAEAGLAHWRVAYTWGAEETRKALPEYYRPILACQFGSAKSYPMAYLMSAFIWHSQRGLVRDYLMLGTDRREIFGSQWPDYGFDEWFLLVAMFPRMAFEGILSFVPWEDRSLNQWFALDIEYCTWANPNSEIMYHSDPGVRKVALLEKKTLRRDEELEGNAEGSRSHIE